MLLAELFKVNEAYLNSVCAKHLSESQALDFERELPGSDDRSKQEFLKIPSRPASSRRCREWCCIRCHLRVAVTSRWCACRSRSTEIWVDQVGSVDNLSVTVSRPLLDTLWQGFGLSAACSTVLKATG